MKAIGRTYLAGKGMVGRGINKATSWVPYAISTRFNAATHKIKNMVLAIFNFAFAPPIVFLSLLLGGAAGEEGRAFDSNSRIRKKLGPRLASLKQFSLKYFHYHLPGVLQEWQRKQPSTVIFNNPSKFAVAAPAA